MNLQTEVNLHDVAKVELRQRINPGGKYQWLEIACFDAAGEIVAEVSCFGNSGKQVEVRTIPS